MAKKVEGPQTRGVGRDARLRSFRIDPALLAAARRVLGTPSDAATITAALDYVVLGREMRAGVDALSGINFDEFDPPAPAAVR